MSNTFTITRMTEEDFSGVQEQWNSLLSRSVTNEMFLSWEWMFSWWEAFKDENKSLLVLAGKDRQGKLIGIAPFYLEKKSMLGTRIVRFCSSVETAADHLDVLCEKEYKECFPAGVFAHLQEHREEWDIIRFDGVKEESCIKSCLAAQNGYALNGIIIDCSPYSRCPYLTIDQSFGDYLKSFSGKTRNTLSRKKRRLLEEEKFEFREINRNTVNPEQYLDELFRLHEERAKRKEIKTQFCGDKVRYFHRSLVGHLLPDERVVMVFLAKGSEFLAAYYCIRHNGKYYYYQAGISEQGEQKSAGTVLLSLLIEKAFNEGCREFDFLRGMEKYKDFWTNASRLNYSFIIRKNNLAGKIAQQFMANVAKPGKKILKKVLRMRGMPRMQLPT